MDKLTDQLFDCVRRAVEVIECNDPGQHELIAIMRKTMADYIEESGFYAAAKADENIIGKCDVWTCPHVDAKANGGWLPIESAPKDGTLFLCWVSAERWSQVDGGGSGMSADTSEVDFCQWRDNNGNGYFMNMLGQIGDMQDITHWMPLPTPPEQNCIWPDCGDDTNGLGLYPRGCNGIGCTSRKKPEQT